MRHRGRIIISLAAAIASGAALWFWWLPLPEPAVGTLTLIDSRGREIAEIASPEARAQVPRKIDQLGRWLPAVTVALEDHRFYEHRGVDWHATIAASFRNLKSGRIISGGSTITQQLAKLATGRQRRNWTGKMYEMVLAIKIERRWSKDKILTEYLNRSSYGNRRLGPEAAARAYFGKSAANLALNESIFLAGLPQAPTRLNPWRDPERANRKFRRSLARLADFGVITREQQLLFAQSPPVARRIDPPRLAPHFADAVVRQDRSLRGAVRTTLDLDLQSAAERLLHTHLAALNRNYITEAAMVVLDNETGAVRAMVGSENYRMSQINGAMRARSAGSTLKPFVYLAALDRRLLTAATLLPDTPDAIRGEYADYDPQNYNHRYLGPVRMREALGCSLNVSAVFALSQLGARPAFHELKKWGFDFPRELSDYGAGFVLGNAEIRLVDLAGSYAGLARGGLAMRTKFLAAEHHQITRIASREATAIITDILCDNDARQKSFGARSPLAFAERVAVKTGTSSGFRDAWTVGYNKEHTVAVWAGNFNGSPMRDTLAVRSATPLWAAMMHELLQRDHPLDPPAENEQLVRQEVCAETGLLPAVFSKTTLSELFLAGTEPREDSSLSFTTDGKLVLGEQYAAWCASADNMRGAQVRASPRITNPPANARYEIDSVLPRSQQMIELNASLDEKVEWFVNGTPQVAQHDGRFFWPLAHGEWTVRAVSRAGDAETSFTVE